MDLYEKDLNKLKQAYKRQGYIITNPQAEDIWSNYSEDLCASWMMMDDNLDNLFEITKEYAKTLNII